MADYCPACAQAVSDTMRACPRCGAALPAVGAARASAAGAGATASNVGASLAAALPPTSYAAELLAPRATPYAKAPFGGRVVAALLDGLIIGLAWVPGALLLGLGGAFAGARDGAGVGGGGLLMLLGVLLLAVGGLWSLWYNFTRDGGGAGFGKRAMGLMVVHLPDNLPCTRGQSAVRTLVWTVLGFVPLVGWLVEPILAIVDKDGRRLGDRAADTQVIAAGDYTA